MNGGRSGVGFAGGSSGSVVGFTIRGFENYGIWIQDNGSVVINSNVIEQTTGWGMALSGARNALIHDNVILENNYWGTTDADEIATYIIDGHDMPNVNMFVIFEPFLSGPVRTEQKTWSEVKGLFRE